jgi:hypothetical protein
MYGLLAVWIGVVVTVNRRATAGLSGRSMRRQRAYGAVGVTALVAVSVFQGVLGRDGVSQRDRDRDAEGRPARSRDRAGCG